VSQEPIHYSIFAADIENYSGRRPLGQLELRHLLSAALDEAAGQSAAGRSQWIRQDQGDGELALVPATVSKPRLVAELIRELKIALDRRNEARKPADRLRLRVAMHYGDVHVDGTGFAGDAPVVASRLLDSEQLRKALDAVPNANLVIILSAPMFAAVNGYRDITEDKFTPVRVRVPSKRFIQDAWVSVPDFRPPEVDHLEGRAGQQDTQARTKERGEPPDPAASKPSLGRVVFHGPVSFGDGPVAGRDINFGGR